MAVAINILSGDQSPSLIDCCCQGDEARKRDRNHGGDGNHQAIGITAPVPMCMILRLSSR